MLYDVCVYATVLGLSGQSSGGFDLGHNSPGRSESSNNASMVLGLHIYVRYERTPWLNRGWPRWWQSLVPSIAPCSGIAVGVRKSSNRCRVEAARAASSPWYLGVEPIVMQCSCIFLVSSDLCMYSTLEPDANSYICPPYAIVFLEMNQCVSHYPYHYLYPYPCIWDCCFFPYLMI